MQLGIRTHTHLTQVVGRIQLLERARLSIVSVGLGTGILGPHLDDEVELLAGPLGQLRIGSRQSRQ